jgi:hypothetical protein
VGGDCPILHLRRPEPSPQRAYLAVEAGKRQSGAATAKLQTNNKVISQRLRLGAKPLTASKWYAPTQPRLDRSLVSPCR